MYRIGVRTVETVIKKHDERFTLGIMCDCCKKNIEEKNGEFEYFNFNNGMYADGDIDKQFCSKKCLLKFLSDSDVLDDDDADLNITKEVTEKGSALHIM